MYQIIFLIIFILIILVYFNIAERFRIIDNPNERSSHSKITIRGAGIIIPISFISSWIFGFTPFYCVVAISLVGMVSFIDDLKGLHQIPRLIGHLIATGLILYSFDLIQLNWAYLILITIVYIAWINAFNFMDGLNGLMVLYGIISLANFHYISTDPKIRELVILVIIACIVFAFFNVRKSAKAFAGDVGSISLAFILGYFMIDLIIKSGRWEYILFFSVFGIDSAGSIIFRLIKKENIFKAHRTHLYQYFANELRVPHVKVSVIYASIQMIINIVVICGIKYGFMNSFLASIFLLLLVFFYLIIRAKAKSVIFKSEMKLPAASSGVS